MASEAITYDKRELRGVIQAFKAMDDQAIDEARKESSALAEYAANQIKKAAATRTVSGVAARRIADGVKVSKTSKVGEFSYGFARQKFSGGGSTLTQQLIKNTIVGDERRGFAGYFRKIKEAIEQKQKYQQQIIEKEKEIVKFNPWIFSPYLVNIY